jgi:hypothetical protein
MNRNNINYTTNITIDESTSNISFKYGKYNKNQSLKQHIYM